MPNFWTTICPSFFGAIMQKKFSLLAATCLLSATFAHASESIPDTNAPAQKLTDELKIGLEGSYALPSGSRINIVCLDGQLYLVLPNGYRRALLWDGHDRFVTRDGKVTVRQASNGNDALFVGLQ
jgi:hypothetical protein